MVIQGKNLIISIAGQALAASKSCKISVKTKTLPVSSPTDGQWEHAIASRKSWSVRTSHLLTTAVVPDGNVSVVSYGFTGSAQRTPSYVKDGVGIIKGTVTRGVSAIRLSSTAPYGFLDDTFTNWDTYTDPSAPGFEDYLANNTDCIIAVVCTDAFAMTQNMANAFSSTNKHVTPPVMATGRHAMSIICGNTLSKGVCNYTENDGKTDPIAGNATAKLYLRAGGVVFQTPFRDKLAMIGRTFTLRADVEGFPYDSIEGEVICTAFDADANIGSLVHGNFEFLGNGPLG
jgi:hypothetical protein